MFVEELPEELHAHEQELYEGMRAGLRLFLSRFGDRRAGMTKRSERSNIHDCIVEEMKKRFDWMLEQNLFLVKIGSYRIKIKKFDNALHTRNIRTQLVLAFVRQRATALFEHDTIRLHLGYIPDALDVTQSTIWMTRPTGTQSNDWEYELREAQAAPPVPAVPVTSPDVPATGVRVKPKRQRIAKAPNSD